MAKPELVSYLKDNLNKFPADELKKQLAGEGVSDADFEEALKVVQEGPPKKPAKLTQTAGRVFLAVGCAAIGVAAWMAVNQKPPPPESPPPAAPAPGAESAFVGRGGWVVRLPRDYAAVTGFKDQQKTTEVVHFCKAGTDPTSLLDEGLYGQLGIVRLEVSASPFAGNLNGLEHLTRIVTARAQGRGEKFILKNLQAGPLHGIQLTYDAPFSRVEAYVLGQKVLYAFMAGQEDEIYRDILNSLRDEHTEI